MGDKCTREDWLDHLYTIMDISNWCKNNEMQCSVCTDKYGACRRNMAILETRAVIHECFDLKEKEMEYKAMFSENLYYPETLNDPDAIKKNIKRIKRMARFEMFTDHRRPCFIRGQKGKLTKAFFHCFVSESEPISPCRIIQLTYAIVETENGQVHKINPTSVIFNNGGKFKDYDWSYEEKEKENV